LFRGTTGCGVRSNHIRPGIRSVASGSLNASSISYSVRPATVYEKEPGGSLSSLETPYRIKVCEVSKIDFSRTLADHPAQIICVPEI
jgi:hypothetical protein